MFTALLHPGIAPLCYIVPQTDVFTNIAATNQVVITRIPLIDVLVLFLF